MCSEHAKLFVNYAFHRKKMSDLLSVIFYYENKLSHLSKNMPSFFDIIFSAYSSELLNNFFGSTIDTCLQSDSFNKNIEELDLELLEKPMEGETEEVQEKYNNSVQLTIEIKKEIETKIKEKIKELPTECSNLIRDILDKVKDKKEIVNELFNGISGTSFYNFVTKRDNLDKYCQSTVWDKIYYTFNYIRMYNSQHLERITIEETVFDEIERKDCQYEIGEFKEKEFIRMLQKTIFLLEPYLPYDIIHDFIVTLDMTEIENQSEMFGMFFKTFIFEHMEFRILLKEKKEIIKQKKQEIENLKKEVEKLREVKREKKKENYLLKMDIQRKEQEKERGMDALSFLRETYTPRNPKAPIKVEVRTPRYSHHSNISDIPFSQSARPNSPFKYVKKLGQKVGSRLRKNSTPNCQPTFSTSFDNDNNNSNI